MLDGVLTVTANGESVSVAMPHHAVAITSVARIILKSLVSRQRRTTQLAAQKRERPGATPSRREPGHEPMSTHRRS